MIKKYTDLKIWLKSMELVTEIYKATQSFPKNEMYGLTSQMQRSAVSIPSNIAEGFCRYKPKEFNRFLLIALGSCAEAETQVRIAGNLQYIDSDLKELLLEKLDHISKMIRAFARRLPK